MAWFTNTKTGGKFNTDWVNNEVDLRVRQLRTNAEEAYKASLQNSGSTIATNYEEQLIHDSALAAAEEKGYVEKELKARIETLKSDVASISSDEGIQEKYDAAVELENELRVRLNQMDVREDRDTIVTYLQATQKIIKLLRGL